MTANYTSPPFSPFPLELNGASSSIACPIFFNNGEEQRGIYRNDQYYNHEVQGKELLLGSSSSSSSCDLDHELRNDQSFKFSIWKKKKEDHHQHDSNKWMSSKMKLMKKMMNNNNDHDHDHVIPSSNSMAKKFLSSSSQTDNTSGNPTDIGSPIRVCSDCNTTKTPLWRSGPRGPKSLCNACGIRQRKARRAAMAAAAVASGSTVTEVIKPFAKTTKAVSQKEKKSSNINNNDKILLPFKKRCKLTSTTTPNRSSSNNQKLCFEDLTIILSKNSTYNQRVFPQDEREAAILLMALSYGLVRG
ncbi:hypothetical protein ACFE04_017503 [Oxalis oulophora]